MRMENLKMKIYTETFDMVSEVMDNMDKVAQLTERYLLDDYFRKYNTEDEDQRLAVAFEFNANRMNAEIISDYIFEAMRVLKEFKVLAYSAYETENEKELIAL